MLVKEKINVKIKNKRQLYSLNKNGIKGLVGDVVEMLISELPIGSHEIIQIKCDNCGKLKDMQFNNYYRSTNGLTEEYYCKNKECVNIKRTLNIRKKYGVDNVFQLNDVKEKIKETNLERYGVENPQQNKKIKEKTEATNLERYGFRNQFQCNLIKEKIKETNLERYGVEYPQQSKEIRSKYSTLHKSSKVENELLLFIKNNYDSEIVSNSKKIILGYELDIYIPDLKLAFEFNGLYWHNELSKDKNYHLIKTDSCEKQNIQLIHIYEDDWEFKRDIVKSMILNKLGKTINKIYARKTEIKEITDNKLVRGFLNENHIQGFVGSSIKLGLFYENELVSLMTFGKKRKIMNGISNNSELEMLRFCNKLNTNVIGGASKLFKYFIRNYNFKEITTYADRSQSNGKLYEILGFNFIHKTEPNYFYVVNRKREFRFKYRKDVLIKEGYNANKSEHEIMLERGIYRIYNSGNIKYVHTLDNVFD